MSKGISIAGRTSRSDKHDCYQTPPEAVEKLLRVEQFFRCRVLEPCCGVGAISRMLERAGMDVISSDIRTDLNVYGKKGVSIFDLKAKAYGNIITNPPYNNAQAIIEKSLELTKNKVAMLLKLTFLESAKRYEFFQDTPLKNVWVFCKRITMHPEGSEKPKNSGTITFAWFVWEHGYEGRPQIGWCL